MTPAAIVSQVISAVGWVVVIGIAWRLSDTLATMRTQIETILTNHLPAHLRRAKRTPRRPTPRRRVMQKPILYINEFGSGLYTQRSPLVTPTSSQGLSTIVRTDVLTDGQNIELSNNGTLVRRPGLTRYCSVAFGASDYPLNWHTFRNNSGTIKLMVDGPVKFRALLPAR
jgi:hypothetical protein